MKTTTVPLKHSMNRVPFRLALLIPLAVVCFALSPTARGVCQEGCLANENTVLGDDALLNNTGNANTAIGFEALFSNATGGGNTATGFSALQNNTTGASNTATGGSALELNTTGLFNTADGAGALFFNTTGNFNTGNGANALLYNRTGNENTASGDSALQNNTTGNNNTAIGAFALQHNGTGSNNIVLGFGAGKNLNTGNRNIDIGNPGVPREANTIRIGRVGDQAATFIAGISGVTVPTGVPVVVDTDGHLGTTTSSARFKEAIKPMDKASETILALKPVTFCYKHELDPAGTPQFGLVAEDVEKVNPALVACDEEGKPYTVRYEAVNAMLLNEFLKEHRTVQEQKATIGQLKQNFAKQQKQIEALTAGLQKVTAQLEVNKPAAQTVLNID